MTSPSPRQIFDQECAHRRIEERRFTVKESLSTFYVSHSRLTAGQVHLNAVVVVSFFPSNNEMSSVTIPSDLHARMVKTFRHEYQDEFGNMDLQIGYTRDELIEKYANDICFWKKREPIIDTKKKPNLRTVCAHAIATNAVANMWKLCDEKDIRSEVEALVKTK